MLPKNPAMAINNLGLYPTENFYNGQMQFSKVENIITCFVFVYFSFLFQRSPKL